MRMECKHYESRSYASGDTVRKCNIDLAPEAPWRCPDPCAGYSARMADVAWHHGTAVAPPTPDAPRSVGSDDSIAALLDEAENIVNASATKTRAEVEAERNRPKGLRKLLPKRKGGKKR